MLNYRESFSEIQHYYMIDFSTGRGCFFQEWDGLDPFILILFHAIFTLQSQKNNKISDLRKQPIEFQVLKIRGPRAMTQLVRTNLTLITVNYFFQDQHRANLNCLFLSMLFPSSCSKGEWTTNIRLQFAKFLSLELLENSDEKIKFYIGGCIRRIEIDSN